MNINKRKEDFSKCYLNAVAARCGWATGNWSQDEFKIDVSLSKEITADDKTNKVLHIDFQLKCTDSPTTDNENFVSFTLDQDHYNKLSRRVGGKPMMLVVMVVPRELDDWMLLFKEDETNSHKSTKLRFCGYGAFISDEEGNYLDKDTKTIRFTKGLHEFDAAALSKIEGKLKSTEYMTSVLTKQLERLRGGQCTLVPG